MPHPFQAVTICTVASCEHVCMCAPEWLIQPQSRVCKQATGKQQLWKGNARNERQRNTPYHLGQALDDGTWQRADRSCKLRAVFGGSLGSFHSTSGACDRMSGEVVEWGKQNERVWHGIHRHG